MNRLIANALKGAAFAALVGGSVAAMSAPASAHWYGGYRYQSCDRDGDGDGRPCRYSGYRHDNDYYRSRYTYRYRYSDNDDRYRHRDRDDYSRGRDDWR